MDTWQFWIDVGGTFTDCVSRDPDGRLQTTKTLSSGRTKGEISSHIDQHTFVSRSFEHSLDQFWLGYRFDLLDDTDQVCWSSTIAEFRASEGRFQLTDPLPAEHRPNTRFECSSDEDAPILCIRKVFGLGLSEAIPAIHLRLGTTRGTNALLERKGARTAFVTTKGFADILRIGNQDRPKLFELNIRKPMPLFETVLEIDERLTADGEVLVPLNEADVIPQLERLNDSGIESIAICLLNSYANPIHEIAVERLAKEAGFQEISRSGSVAPMIKIVSRGDTTTVDAYLNPVLRQYIDRLKASLPGSKIQMMTSSGGLVDAEHFVGKDSILSGPAGGVIGYAKIAQAAGLPKAIGFDMGGTSTDVSRFDGRFNREYETQKAGVRVVSPMLAIETVAAGGGSVCQFDGVKLTVGPESAGANPGPACYGRGGPLTVTDMNLILGRLPVSHFPFPLDQSAAEKRLHSLIDVIVAAGGPTYSIQELAQGFLDIANANMSRAIRKISVAEGYDPREFGLVTFGGAGAQHACAIARELGITKILVHPLAGVLSAYGIGQAEIRVIREQTVLKELNEVRNDLPDLFQRLERDAKIDLQEQDVSSTTRVDFQRSLHARYQGTESTIEILLEDQRNFDRDVAESFTAQHRKQFGYARDDRKLEVTVVRVEAIGRTIDESSAVNFSTASPQPTEYATSWFNNVPVSTPLLDRNRIEPDETIVGPAIISDDNSTIVIEPDFSATMTGQREFLIESTLTENSSTNLVDTSNIEPDPILLEIFNNLFASIAEQMGESLRKTSCSTNVKERLDFSCAVFTASGELVANAPHIPVHLGAMGESVKSILADNPSMKRGDVYVTNDPFRGGSHLPDVTVVTPVFGSEALQFFVASRAHHAEIGGTVPGSMPAFSQRLSDEGVLIRNFKLVDGDASREGDLRTLLLSGEFPTRAVDDNLADIAAQVAANQTGSQLLNELVTRYSLPTVQSYMEFIRQAAARKMRQAIEQIPNGEYTMTDSLDDGSSIVVRITIQHQNATVDFTGTASVLRSNLNANRSIVTAAVLYVFRCLINEDIPLNSGVLEPVEIVLPECMLNPPASDDPRTCAAMVGGNVETSQRIVDVLLGAMNIAAASQGTMNNLTFGDTTFGYYETICGGSGATPSDPGADAVHTHMTNTRLTDVEVIEKRFPVRIRRFAIRKHSGGLGMNPGGDGIIREIEFLKPLQVSMLSQRRGDFQPFGIQGGKPAESGRNSLLQKSNGETVDLGGSFQIDVRPGDVLTIRTPGGGGFGATTKTVN